MNPTAVHSILERVTAEDDEGAEDHSLEEEEEEGAAHSLKDVCDFGKPEPSPFSSRRVMYENEEVGPSQRATFIKKKSMNIITSVFTILYKFYYNSIEVRYLNTELIYRSLK